MVLVDQVDESWMETNFIYSLSDDSGIRYIGKSSNPNRRLTNGHIARSRLELNDKSRKAVWIRSLLAEGKEPKLGIVEEVPVSRWQEREKHWIAHYRNQGNDLVNYLDGGKDGAKGKKWTPEMREKRRLNWERKSQEEKDAIKAKLSAAQKGKSFSEEHLAKIREAMSDPDYREGQRQRSTEARAKRFWSSGRKKAA